MKKIVNMTASCGACPNYQYYSGGRSVCRLVDQVVRNKEEVAPFCPLPDYPARTIAGMEATIERLREPNKYSLHLAVLSHIATKLKKNLDADGGSIVIPYRDGKEEKELRLDVHCILSFDTQDNTLCFIHDGEKFRLRPDTAQPHLEIGKEIDGQDLYRRLEIR